MLQGENHIENRIIGCEVYCVKKRIYVYNTDDLVGGGANIMIEVIRQAFKQLIADLRSEGIFHLPKDFLLQFDNCKENKVRLLIF